MVTIQNKKVKIKGNEATYADIIKQCINQRPPQGGFTVDEMRTRLKILDVVDSAKKKMEFEDADFKILQTAVKQMKWAVIDPAIVEFSDTITQIENKK